MTSRFAVTVVLLNALAFGPVTAQEYSPYASPAPTPQPSLKPWPTNPGVSYPCTSVEINDRFSQVNEALNVSDTSKAVLFENYGEDMGVCFDKYGLPGFLFDQATFYYATAKCYAIDGEYQHAINLLVASTQALSRTTSYQIPPEWRKWFDAISRSNLTLGEAIRREMSAGN